jgi:7-cyano-7-deazaguanine reductase
VTNRILDEMVAATKPRFMRLTARWYVRGGLFTTVVAEHRKRGWTPAPRVDIGHFPAEASTRG